MCTEIIKNHDPNAQTWVWQRQDVLGGELLNRHTYGMPMANQTMHFRQP